MEVLVHYTKYSKFKEILKTGGLKFGNMTNSNDPFEKEDLIGDIVHTSNEIHSANNITEHTFLFCDRGMTSETNFQRFFQMLCFCLDKMQNPLHVELERMLMKPRMWSQYGYDNEEKECIYLGVAIILDKAKFDTELNNNTEIFQSDLICYDLNREFVNEHRKSLENILNTYNDSDDDTLNKNIFDYCKENYIYLKKHHDWKEENEFRYLIKQQGNVIVPIHSSVLGIVFLEKKDKISNEYEDLITEYPNTLNTHNVFFMNWERGFPEIQSHKNRKLYQDIVGEAWDKKR